MSWLTEFAGKAENLLNAMDKGAATALTGVGKNVRKYSIKSDTTDTVHNDTSSVHLDTEYIETPDIMSLKTSPSTSSLYSGGNGNNNGVIKSHTRTSSYESVGSRGSKVLDDERLLDYLNNKESNIPEEEWRTLDDSNSLNEDLSIKINDDQVHKEAITNVHEVKIEALAKELSTLNKRYMELNSEYKQLQRKAINFHNQNLSNEKSLKELKSRESDLNASLSAKDTQIAAFKVQLEQINLEIKQKEDKNAELESLTVQLQQMLDEKPQVNNELTVNLEKEIANLKQSLQEERDELKRISEFNNQQINRLEDNQRSLVDELEHCQRLLSEAKSSKAEMELSNILLQKKLEGLESEYTEFKVKANKTLQDKDELIQVLSGNKTDNETLQKSANSSNEKDEHIRLLQEQSDALISDLTDLRAKYDSVRAALEKAENEKIPRQQYEIEALQEELDREKVTSKNLKQEVSQLSADSKSYQDDLNQIRANLSARIVERDDEIEKLRKQLMLKQRGNFVTSNLDSSPSDNASSDEWEQRLKALTENLISKQSLVEQLSSANHSLKLQLERSEQRIRDMASSTTNYNNDVAIGIYHSPTFTNLIKHRMTNNSAGDSVPLIEDNPSDGNVTRKVKRAYGAIDAFSIRLGNFLRVYPSARAAFLIYILVLHIWVAFILIYYEPEIHSPDFHSNL